MRELPKKLALKIPAIRKLHEERDQCAKLLDISNENVRMLQEKLKETEAEMHRMQAMPEWLKELKDAEFPVYMNLSAPSFAQNEVVDMNRTIVLTIPKSGTYLIGAYLKKLGLIDTGVHLDDVGFTDYRNRSIQQMVESYRDFRKIYPLDRAVKLLRNGQFAVGHIGFNEKTVRDLAETNVIFVSRELRSALISMMRWLSRPGRGEASEWRGIEDNRHKLIKFLSECGENLISWYGGIAGWRDFHGVLSVQFERMLKADLRADLALEISERCGLHISKDAAREAIDGVINKPTKTWSGMNSKIDDYWTEEAESIFISIGGMELNRRLGYDL
jgi:hypothetical protein